jgi:uncharacterized RDD family membrane protein YckC
MMVSGMLALLMVDTQAATRSKVSLVSRVVAKLIDIAFVMLLSALLPHPVGPLVGFLYSLSADGMRFWIFDAQSLGKKVMGLKVRSLSRGGPASLKDSVLRNAPVGVATFFAIIPIWGWLILGLIGLPLMAMEIYLMITVETGHRLGDVMGDTEVVEA